MNESPTPHFLSFSLAIVVTLFFCGVSTSTAAGNDKPNIVFIMADDLGWADVGYNGATFYETPHIDDLSRAGMRFSNAYPGASNCMPSRSCIMSGAYTPRTQMWTPGGKAKGNIENMKFLVPRNSDKAGDDALPSKLELDPSVVSIAETLKSVGYRAAHLGKWHLGPDGQGFDINDTNGLGADLSHKYYGDIDVAEKLTDRAIEFIAQNQENPFFIYLCHWDVHTPLKARSDVIAKYQRKLKSKKWDHDWNTTYAAMIEAVDTSVGRVYAALKNRGIEKNTLFIFTSDNGGSSGSTLNEPLRGAKGAFYEGGIRTPMIAVWPKVISPGTETDTPITGVDYLPTFADLAGASLPRHQPVDGRSIAPLFRGEDIEERSIFWHYPLYLSGAHYNQVRPIHGTGTLYWRASPCSVIRKGDWKLIQYFEDGSIELFNIKRDIEESRELSKTNPEKASELLAELKLWQVNTEAVIPDKLNPDFAH